MRIAVIGAGLMGRAAVFDLAGNHEVTTVGVFDINDGLATEIAERYGRDKASPGRLDAGVVADVSRVLRDFDAAVSCVTYSYNPGLTRAAIEAGCHLVDLGGNNDVVRTQLAMNDMARAAGISVVPDCGLAPGMVSVLAADGIGRFESIRSLKIRVGGLPQSPRPPLNYQLVFSAEGLLNEYWEPCLILEDGHRKTVNPMTGLETLRFDGIGEFEAFYTSGGASTLPETYEGAIEFLDYKTIRYPGHCRMFRAMFEIGLASRQALSIEGHAVRPRALLRALLEKNLSFHDPDMVLARLTFEGCQHGETRRLVYEIVDRQDSRSGLTAMMRTTAFPATIIAEMAATGKLTETGCRPQEVVVRPSLFIPELRKRGINLVIREQSE